MEIFLRAVMREMKRPRTRGRAPPGASWSALAERSGDSAFGRRGISLPPETFRAGEGGGALRWPPQSKTRTGRWKKICFDGAYFRRDLAAKTFLTAKDTNLASDRNRRKSIKSCYNPSSVSFN